ncbi:deoxyribodipyrimidine photo-lyase-like protein [Dissoconium aciculare CBS 342.82]|uniref:Deoxyribodipyrimidine photo-lyase-like protein n=1 Tax=Dissoconium aciculare CBS 342.82 TaxID=1314786 RepID=A0A6J3MEF9_9PEZI|nr:deoxyribodipyrimidine photo-lyase-like protein [Dissoconium aciculare CBS 342.82]KAF1825237.1 deoxyribodipyrimidine photo-lyase-like protein [Dissoconium aciculare CBS 342.82]
MALKRRATSHVQPSPSNKKRQIKLEDTPVAIKSEIKDEFSEDIKPRVIPAAKPSAHEVPVVQREFYPAEMSNARCAKYNSGELPRPLHLLNETIRKTLEQRKKIAVGDSVIHWFKRDLRLNDNRALAAASEKARSKNIPLICMFIVSPQDYQAHLTSAVRVDFELRTLAILKADLDKLNIPLFITTIDSRKDVPSFILKKSAEWGAKHVFCNIEYEVDELRRENKLITECLGRQIDFSALHDDVLVPPGNLQSGAGKQYSVYSPWFKAWVRHLHDHPHLLKGSELPQANDKSARSKFKSLFDAEIPSAPSNKTLTSKEKTHFAHLWPAGEHEAQARMERFARERISKYKDARNFLAENANSSLSVHFSSGTLSARTAIRCAQSNNSSPKLDAGNAGIMCWISEVAWRDFYKHVLAHWPFVCMHKPFKYEYSDIKWDYNEEHFQRWCNGQTGFPVVDAAMRQLKSTGYMHNRARMIVASFLAKDLLLDWRKGERYFMENLVDGDFASNNGGWGFSASTGVDPQPYFRIFNPLLQSEKFDASGEYIRKWVPELKDVVGKAIHDPYGRGAEKIAKTTGYPKPMVDHSERRKIALDRYKSGLGRETANVGGGVHN